MNWIPLAELEFSAQNPNRGDIPAIVKSIQKFGFNSVSGVFRGKMKDGQHRCLALRQLQQAGYVPSERDKALRVNATGEWEIAVLDLNHFQTEAEADAFMLAMNRTTRLGSDDTVQLAELLQSLESDMRQAAGYSDGDLTALLAELEPPELKDNGGQIDRAGELQDKWQVQPGDVWVIHSNAQPGKFHRVLCGDCTDKAQVEKLMQGKKADCVITDPPYNVGIKYGNETNDNQGFQEYKAWSQQWLLNCPPKKLLSVGIKRLFWWDEIAGYPQWVIAWVKRNGQGQTKLGGTNKWDAFLVYDCKPDNQPDMIEVNNDYSGNIKSSGGHPTAKPVELWVKLIERFTVSKQILYEPFLGSGTTLIAAEQTGRLCYGMEIHSPYVAVILQRATDAGLRVDKV